MKTEESKRIKALRESLIKRLPCFPNDKETISELQNKELSSLLHAYLHWATRIVPARRRKYSISPEVTRDKRWKFLKNEIEALLIKVQNGEDLSPHLSEKAHLKGYTPTYQITSGKEDSWADKDRILNTMGYHHFHLSSVIASNKLTVRTNEVLFAHITREHFKVIGIFDHNVFKCNLPNDPMTSERQRLWNIHEKRIEFSLPIGTTGYIGKPISPSGHPASFVQLSIYLANIIKSLDSHLDTRENINIFYKECGYPPPKKYQFQWLIKDLDLFLYNKKNEDLFLVYESDI